LAGVLERRSRRRGSGPFRPETAETGIPFEENETMTSTSEVAVTLTPELFAHLKAEADLLGLPMEWLVASIVADTFDETAVEPALA
jgi:hypothetical protein